MGRTNRWELPDSRTPWEQSMGIYPGPDGVPGHVYFPDLRIGQPSTSETTKSPSA
jgi:hypothetical protein